MTTVSNPFVIVIAARYDERFNRDVHAFLGDGDGANYYSNTDRAHAKRFTRPEEGISLAHSLGYRHASATPLVVPSIVAASLASFKLEAVLHAAAVEEFDAVMANIAQGAINIAEGRTTIEPTSRVHKAMLQLCRLVNTGAVGVK